MQSLDWKMPQSSDNVPKVKIINQGLGATLEYTFNEGESLYTESDAMLAMTPNISLSAGTNGGILKSIGRKLVGESLFQSKYTATADNQKLILAPQFIGDIVHLPIQGMPFIIQKQAYLASTEGVEVTLKTQSLAKGLFSKEGFFVTKVTGMGDLFLNAYGSIIEFELQAGEKMRVDNGHLVAWQASIDYDLIKSSASVIATLFSGECIVCEFTGPGKIYVQSRNTAIRDSHIALIAKSIQQS